MLKATEKVTFYPTYEITPVIVQCKPSEDISAALLSNARLTTYLTRSCADNSEIPTGGVRTLKHLI